MASILIVDDSRFTRLKMSEFLRSRNFTVTEAANGEEGLDEYERRKPDCIICDLLMPKMDGYRFLEEIRKIDADIPVLIVTADIQETTKRRIIDLGGTDIFPKPTRYEELLEKIELELGKSSR